MLALAGQPSLHGYCAYLVYWAEGSLWRNCGQKQCETSFSLQGFFCLVEILGFAFGVLSCGIFGLGGLNTPLASVGQPSLHSFYARIVCWADGHLVEIASKNKVRPLFLLMWVFLFSRDSRVRLWGLILWHFWIGRARHPGPAPPCHVAVEVFNVGS